MSEPFDLQAIGCKVYSVLTENPKARDDDKILLIEIWSKESRAQFTPEFWEELMTGRVSFPDTITRVRRRLQEQHKALRGEKWEVRHNLEGAFCEQLTFFDLI